jgi:DhnA family fructose-bisphosphate aldolase class Ia
MPTTGETVRLSRLFSNGQNAVVVAIDHGLYFGPLPGLIKLSEVVKVLGGADGVLMSPGSAVHCQELFKQRGAPAMILRLNWSSNYVSVWKYTHAHSVPMFSVAEAVQQGADVVLASLTLHNPDQNEDAHNVEILSRFISEKRAMGVPLIGEVFPTGGDDTPPQELHEGIKVGCRIVAELGVDLVKTFFTGERFEEITAATPIPILALGAKKTPRESDALKLAATAVRAGAKGVVFGRNVIQAREPERFLEALKEVVKIGQDPTKVAAKFNLD